MFNLWLMGLCQASLNPTACHCYPKADRPIFDKNYLDEKNNCNTKTWSICHKSNHKYYQYILWFDL